MKAIGYMLLLGLLVVSSIYRSNKEQDKDETIAQLRIANNNSLKDIQDLEYRLQYCQLLHKGN